MELTPKANSKAPTEGGPKFKKLTTRDTITVVALLTSHCRKEGENAIYDEDWDDARIVLEVGTPTCTINGVARIRTELVGTLIRAKATSLNVNLERLAKLERQLGSLIAVLNVAVPGHAMQFNKVLGE